MFLTPRCSLRGWIGFCPLNLWTALLSHGIFVTKALIRPLVMQLPVVTSMASSQPHCLSSCRWRYGVRSCDRGFWALVSVLHEPVWFFCWSCLSDVAFILSSVWTHMKKLKHLRDDAGIITGPVFFLCATVFFVFFRGFSVAWKAWCF